jgi:hypothetical protein
MHNTRDISVINVDGFINDYEQSLAREAFDCINGLVGGGKPVDKLMALGLFWMETPDVDSVFRRLPQKSLNRYFYALKNPVRRFVVNASEPLPLL